MKITRT